jgi:cyclopropane fatty-acyl-phospholipid synthase-like methyltransferase
LCGKTACRDLRGGGQVTGHSTLMAYNFGRKKMDSKNNVINTEQESIATSMDCEDVELVEYLPYILQDFYEIGSSAQSLARIVKENNAKESVKIIDLGCGKGTVLIELAQRVKSECLGIDGIKEFIDYANEQVRMRGITNCKFKAGDIRRTDKIQGKYDFIILGSIGPVYGDYYTTMEKLKPLLCDDGIIILDDGYIEERKDSTHATIGIKKVLIDQIKTAGMEIIKEYLGDEISDKSEYEKQYQDIKIRCHELMLKYPNKKELFEGYIRKQKEEYHNLEEEITCSTMLIKRKIA